MKIEQRVWKKTKGWTLQDDPDHCHMISALLIIKT